MYAVTTGFLAGAAAGVIMGVISHILFKLHLFNSSLITIDGAFLFRTIKKHTGPGQIAAVGLIIHLITSAVFGALYFVVTAILGISPEAAVSSRLLIGVYVGILWLSMLFIALPIAGEGFLGRHSGRNSWFEQLVLHMIFFVVYMAIVRTLLGR
jgi:hypothetical protein